MNRDRLISSLQHIKTLAEECLASLEESPHPKKATGKAPSSLASPSPTRDPDLSFSLNPRAFIKRYGRGLKGPQKFVLLLARLAGGKISHGVALADMEKHWDSMTALMHGDFNRAHANRAKDKGWVDSPKRGTYVLTSEWKDVFPKH
jgi:hypothetical protein